MQNNSTMFRHQNSAIILATHKHKLYIFRHRTSQILKETGGKGWKNIKFSVYNQYYQAVLSSYPLLTKQISPVTVCLVCRWVSHLTSWEPHTSLISSWDKLGGLSATSAERIIPGVVLVRVLQLVFSVTAVHWMLLLSYSEPLLHLIFQLTVAVCVCVFCGSLWHTPVHMQPFVSSHAMAFEWRHWTETRTGCEGSFKYKSTG